jgi:hypothetical protein
MGIVRGGAVDIRAMIVTGRGTKQLMQLGREDLLPTADEVFSRQAKFAIAATPAREAYGSEHDASSR